MKKLIFVFALVVSVSANASYLYWQVESTQLAAVEAYAETMKENWDIAKYHLYDTSGTEVQLTDGNTAINSYDTEEGYKGGTAAVPVDLGSLTAEGMDGYSYYIELVNSSSEHLLGYQQGTYTAQALSDYVVSGDMDAVASAPVWHGASSYSAPEPTSAMLMLLGVAGLALRRKQRKIA